MGVKLVQILWNDVLFADISSLVIIFLKEVFEGTILSKILLPFPRNPYLEINVASLLILFFVNDFKEKLRK